MNNDQILILIHKKYKNKNKIYKYCKHTHKLNTKNTYFKNYYNFNKNTNNFLFF